MIRYPKLGIALGGGGARGAAHIGVLRYLESIHVRPHCLSGTSAGAIVASLYAFGVPLERIDQELRACKPPGLLDLRLNRLGLFENREILRVLCSLLPVDAQIENAKIPFAIQATDLVTGEGIVLREGCVVSAVLASCCVPGVYFPQEIEGKLLVDGGLTENVPLSALEKLGAHIKIAVNLNGSHKYGFPEGIKDVLENAMDIAIDSHTRRQLRKAHFVISMDLTPFSRTSTEHFTELVEYGFLMAQSVVGTKVSLRLFGLFRSLYRLILDFLPLIKLPEFILKRSKKRVSPPEIQSSDEFLPNSEYSLIRAEDHLQSGQNRETAILSDHA